jgi:hypothetical protein
LPPRVFTLLEAIAGKLHAKACGPADLPTTGQFKPIRLRNFRDSNLSAGD